jgi:hypothetical protein
VVATRKDLLLPLFVAAYPEWGLYLWQAIEIILDILFQLCGSRSSAATELE